MDIKLKDVDLGTKGMLVMYEKVKQGHDIKTLGINSFLFNHPQHGDIHFMIADFDDKEEETKQKILRMTQHFGTSIVYETRRGYHAYFPYHWNTLDGILAGLRRFEVEDDFISVGKDKGFLTLRINKIPPGNEITFAYEVPEPHPWRNGMMNKVRGRGDALKMTIIKLLAITGTRTYDDTKEFVVSRYGNRFEQ